MTSTADAAATARLDVLPAPGGLCLVQDLLNSAAIAAFGVPDLLADAAAAEAWLAQASDLWADQTGQTRPALSLPPGDLVGLREDRERVRSRLGGADVDLPVAAVVLRAGAGGTVTYAPGAAGADGLRGLLLAELMLAAREDTLGRLKTCANPACGVAFYDRSRNSSRVWHDVRTCGNVTNLRASRARRRAAAVDGGGDPPAGG